jgi:GAF domain-containing protein
MDGATVQEAVRDVAGMLIADAPLAVTMQRIADLAQAVAPHTEGVRVSLLDDRGRPDVEVTAGELKREGARDGRSTLTIPLEAGGSVRGMIALHAVEGQPFSEADEANATTFAAHAAPVLVNARAYWDVVEVADGLQEAMQSRAVIEQAKGKLMATEGCTAEQAFVLLTRRSQRENVKVRALARRIVDGTE